MHVHLNVYTLFHSFHVFNPMRFLTCQFHFLKPYTLPMFLNACIFPSVLLLFHSFISKTLKLFIFPQTFQKPCSFSLSPIHAMHHFCFVFQTTSFYFVSIIPFHPFFNFKDMQYVHFSFFTTCFSIPFLTKRFVSTIFISKAYPFFFFML